MTGDKTKFAKLEFKEEGFVTYRDNNKARILGNGVIGNGSSFNIKNVLLVEGLKHNLINEEETALEKQSIAELESAAGNQSTKKEIQSTEKAAHNNLPKEWIEPKGLSKDNIIGDIEQRVSTTRKLAFFQHAAFVSQIKPKNVNDALCDSNWVVAMQDELN